MRSNIKASEHQYFKYQKKSILTDYRFAQDPAQPVLISCCLVTMVNLTILIGANLDYLKSSNQRVLCPQVLIVVVAIGDYHIKKDPPCTDDMGILEAAT